MSKTLTIDRGNTTTKLAVWSDENPSAPVFIHSLANASAADIMRLTEGFDIRRAMLCSVAGDVDRLSELLKNKGITLQLLTSDIRVPITIQYDTPRSLGADRVAALVGAMSCYPGREVFVVDIGTAVTYDRLSADARFLGGNIAPGIGMRLRALNTFTSALPKISSAGPAPLWGHSTETAMRSGAVNGVIAEITYYRSMLPDDTLVVLTGGWSADIADKLPFDAVVNQSLVLYGLNRILQYNENN